MSNVSVLLGIVYAMSASFTNDRACRSTLLVNESSWMTPTVWIARALACA